MNCWMMRITNEWDVSYDLLLKEKPNIGDIGYLSIGWVGWAKDNRVGEFIKLACTDKWKEFDELWDEKVYSKRRNRWQLGYFFSFQKGDKVVVPLYGGDFCVCEVIEEPISVCNLDEVLCEGKSYRQGEDKLLYDRESNRKVDIGFVCKVKIVMLPRKRTEYADPNLQSKMKFFGTVNKINSVEQEVQEAINRNEPINIYKKFSMSVAETLRKNLYNAITPDNFEKLIVWYFTQIGADSSDQLPKYESGKDVGVDADVMCNFDVLGITVLVQVKKYDGETSETAVKQMIEYLKWYEKKNDKVAIPMVITLSEKFSDAAIKLADKEEYGKHKQKIRLIAGDEFVKMLMDVGISKLKEVL